MINLLPSTLIHVHFKNLSFSCLYKESMTPEFSKHYSSVTTFRFEISNIISQILIGSYQLRWFLFIFLTLYHLSLGKKKQTSVMIADVLRYFILHYCPNALQASIILTSSSSIKKPTCRVWLRLQTTAVWRDNFST